MTLTDFISGNAYKIFYSEFAKHINAALAKLTPNVHLSADDLRELSGRFHTIKGGAGFFGLTEIVSFARILEDAFKVEMSTPKDDLLKLISIIDALKQEGDKMPPPLSKD